MNPAPPFTSLALPQAAAAPADSKAVAPAQESDKEKLFRYLRMLAENRYLIGFIVLVTLAFSLAYALLAPPVYQANMLIRVHEGSRGRLGHGVLSEIAGFYGRQAKVDTEIALLQSNQILRHTIENLHLDIQARPLYFPLLGHGIALHKSRLSTPGLFGMGGYAWGTETITVSRLELPPALHDHDLILTSLGEGHFHLLDPDSGIDQEGRTGVPLRAASRYGAVELLVQEMEGKPGAQFLLRRLSPQALSDLLQKSLWIAERGKDSMVIGVTFQDSDPERATQVLSEIAHEYQAQSEARERQATRAMLAGLNRELPGIKTRLEQAERDYQQFRARNGLVGIPEAAGQAMQFLNLARQRQIELGQKRLGLLARYTSQHPLVQGVERQLQQVESEIRQYREQLQALPLLEQEAGRLEREVKIHTQLYTEMLGTAQKLRLGNLAPDEPARVLDLPAKPEKPALPNPRLVLAIGLFVGLYIGVLAVVLKNLLFRTVDDPGRMEKEFRLPVWAAIPHSRRQLRQAALLSTAAPRDPAIESLRGLQLAVQHSLRQARNNIVLFTSPEPGAGKSFMSANLAALMSEAGQKVLLIDADLRRGRLHDLFGVRREIGLTELIARRCDLEQALHRGGFGYPDFISSGAFCRHPAEMLLDPAFATLLSRLAPDYDLILIDSAPLLAGSDTLAIGALAGAIYLVTRAGSTTASEVTEAIRRLSQAGLSLQGIMLNDVKPAPGQQKQADAHALPQEPGALPRPA